MKIGIDVRLWGESGVGRYIRNLIKELQLLDKEDNYALFALNKDLENIKSQIFNSKFQIIKTDIKWHTLDEQLRLPQILSKENLDLVHFPYFSIPVFYNKPFVVTIHDLIIDHFPTGQASTLLFPIYKAKLLGYKFIISQATRKAKKIITVSNTTKKEIKEHLRIQDNKIVVTYEGIDEKISNVNQAIFGQIPNKYQNNKSKIQNKNYFLYVGNAYPHKNLERLISAFTNLKNTRPDMKLVLIGKEDYFYKRLKEKVKKIKMQDSIIFFGKATDEELCELYKNAKALIMPSLMEGFGLPLIEAMKNKCPVVVSDIPVMHEICRNAALYFNPVDIDDISQKINSLFHRNEENINRNIEQGIELTKNFSWKIMAKNTLNIYKEVIDNSRK